jgi:hypothetical protein
MAGTVTFRDNRALKIVVLMVQPSQTGRDHDLHAMIDAQE